MFSKACEYGIRASIYIAEQSMLGKRVNQKEISKAIDSPEAFTAKILQQLTKNKLISSEKGPSGGFTMNTTHMDELKLSNVVSAIDGDEIYKGCGLGLDKCNAQKPCPAHERFKRVRDELKQMLETTSLKELTLGLKEGVTFLKR